MSTSTVEVFAWNPRRPLVPGPLGHRLRYGRRVNNFGDLLGPLLVGRLLASKGLVGAGRRPARLLSVGSVLHYAGDGDVVWGSGRNGKIPDALHTFADLDVRAVRGPLTRQFLQQRGIAVPEIYGDPALLLPNYLPEMWDWTADKRYEFTVVPNLNEIASVPAGPEVLDPRRPVLTCLERIARSRFVTGSSLHAIVVAESLGIPARLIGSRVEADFKYADYYGGTGRSGFTPAASVAEARELGGEEPARWDGYRLLESFPWDLWDR